MNRRSLIRSIENRIGRRKLVWLGTRGVDAQPLLQLSQFSEVYSLIAPLRALSLHAEISLEDMKNVRVDLDKYSLDRDNSEQADELRRRLLDSLRAPSVIVAYRPLAFLSSVVYPRRGYVEYLGLFHERQAPFEHKPWVESELQELGIRTIPWKYYADADRPRVQEDLDTFGTLVLRSIRSDGGAGFKVVRCQHELGESWEMHPEAFFAAAPLLYPHIPLNVNACVFRDGRVTLHGPSVQLIGIPHCTKRPFGYCGNDFGAVRNLDRTHLIELEAMTTVIGRWLARRGYLGAFGVDALIYEGQVYLTEINPRFQGSSAMSALLDEQLGRTDLFLNHIAAFLDLPRHSNDNLCEIAFAQTPVTQIICHNQLESTVRLMERAPPAEGFQRSLVPKSTIRVEKEGILCRLSIDQSITSDGLSVARFAECELQKITELIEERCGDIEGIDGSFG